MSLGCCLTSHSSSPRAGPSRDFRLLRLPTPDSRPPTPEAMLGVTISADVQRMAMPNKEIN
jgi:hypothetical protein